MVLFLGERSYILGDRRQLAGLYSNYRQRETLQFPILTYQLKQYADIIVTSLAYIATDQTWPSRLHLAQLLRYCLRFILTELLIDQLLPDEPNPFWDRGSLATICQNQFPNLPQIAKIIRQPQTLPKPFSDPTLERWFFDLLLITEIGLDAFDQYELFPEPEYER